MAVVIRKAKTGDFPGVFQLFGQLWPNRELHENAMREVFERGCASASDDYFCAEQDGTVIGFCAAAVVNNFWQEGQIAYVYAMIVEEALRGQGIGSQLLNAALDTAKARGCKRLELDSGFHREQAHLFYTEKMGFEKRAFLFSKDLT